MSRFTRFFGVNFQSLEMCWCKFFWQPINTFRFLPCFLHINSWPTYFSIFTQPNTPHNACNTNNKQTNKQTIIAVGAYQCPILTSFPWLSRFNYHPLHLHQASISSTFPCQMLVCPFFHRIFSSISKLYFLKLYCSKVYLNVKCK